MGQKLLFDHFQQTFQQILTKICQDRNREEVFLYFVSGASPRPEIEIGKLEHLRTEIELMISPGFVIYLQIRVLRVI